MTWPNYSPATRQAVNDLLKQGGSLSAYRANPKFPSWTGPTEGSYAYRLEREIEKRFKVKHAIAVNSGTAALHAALTGANVRGFEVVTSPYTFSATASAILLAGGTPVFADVDPYTFCITKETVKNVLTKKTKAILPVHLFGGLADVRSLKDFGLPVIEDACQAVGAKCSDGYSGSLGEAGAYSFNGAKNIPSGEAGCLVTNSSGAAETARLLMNHGENFNQSTIGLNYRPNEVTCAIAYHGLLELEERNRKRAQLAWILTGTWVSLYGDADEINAPLVHNLVNPEHVFYVYPFTVKSNRHRFALRMKRMGIPVGEGYIQPTLQHYKAFRKYARGPLPVVEELSSKTLCILSTLTPDRPLSYASHVADCIRKALS